jgi:hypothetical protein
MIEQRPSLVASLMQIITQEHREWGLKRKKRSNKRSLRSQILKTTTNFTSYLHVYDEIEF